MMEKDTNVNKIDQLKKDNGEGEMPLKKIVDVNAESKKLDLSKGAEPIKLSEEDRLMAENLQLKVMNISLQEQSLIQQIAQLRSERESMQQQLLAHRDEMSKKYGIDFTKFDVRAGDGMIVPKGSTPPGLIR